MLTWKELHEVKSFEGIEDKVTVEQKALIIVANNIDRTTFILSEAGFNMKRAAELSEKLSSPSRFAEYLESKIDEDDLPETAVMVAANSKPDQVAQAIMDLDMNMPHELRAAMMESMKSTVPKDYN